MFPAIAAFLSEAAPAFAAEGASTATATAASESSTAAVPAAEGVKATQEGKGLSDDSSNSSPVRAPDMSNPVNYRVEDAGSILANLQGMQNSIQG